MRDIPGRVLVLEIFPRVATKLAFSFSSSESRWCDMLVKSGPGEIVFAERDREHSFRWQEIHGQAPFPQGDAEEEFAPFVEIEEFAREAYFENFSVGSRHDCFRM